MIISPISGIPDIRQVTLRNLNYRMSKGHNSLQRQTSNFNMDTQIKNLSQGNELSISIKHLD